MSGINDYIFGVGFSDNTKGKNIILIILGIMITIILLIMLFV